MCVCALFVSMFCVVMEDFMMLVLMFLVRGDLAHDRRFEKRSDMLLAGAGVPIYISIDNTTSN